MLVSLVLVSVLALALGEPLPQLMGDYHLEIGIPTAARIKAAEEAHDFDGSRISRIVGGTPATLGAYPYYGGLLVTLTSGGLSACGSSLISSTRIVTAAHCWRHTATQGRSIEVVFASLSLYTGGTRRTTSNVIEHPSYYPRFLWNDVAVAIIAQVQSTNLIQPIALPSGTLLQQTFAGWTAQACGFGAQADGAGIVLQTHRLHHTSLSVITNAECLRFYSSVNVLASTLCVDGSDRRSTCRGDSGGPLQVTSNGAPLLIGITSYGYTGGCEVGWPAAFARVTSYADWLRAQM